MKKIISTMLMVMISLFIAMPANAQLKFGIKGGANLSKGDFSTTKQSVGSLKANNFSGFFIGPMAQINIPIIGLGLDGALFYSHNGTKYTYTTSTTTTNGTNNQNAIEIPIDLRYSLGLGSLLGIFFTAGPSFTFNIGNKDGFTDIANNVVSSKWKNQEVAINLGGGIKMMKHLEIGLNYKMPLTQSATINSTTLLDNGSYKNKTWQLSGAYIF